MKKDLSENLERSALTDLTLQTRRQESHGRKSRHVSAWRHRPNSGMPRRLQVMLRYIIMIESTGERMWYTEGTRERPNTV